MKNKNMPPISYGSDTYVLLCYARMKRGKWFSRDDYRAFERGGKNNNTHLSASISKLVSRGFIAIRQENGKDYYKITEEGTDELFRMAGEQRKKMNALNAHFASDRDNGEKIERPRDKNGYFMSAESSG
jgi:hypothetical protein